MNDADANSAVIAYRQICSADDVKTATMLALLVQLSSSPAFDQLRTKEQLGYIVFLFDYDIGPSLSLSVLVQGSTHDAAYLAGRVEAFLKAHSETLQQMP